MGFIKNDITVQNGECSVGTFAWRLNQTRPVERINMDQTEEYGYLYRHSM